MPNYQYSADIVDAILFQCDEPTDGTSEFNSLALQYANRAYTAICAGGSELDPDVDETWWWLRSRSPGVLTLLPQETGTAALTNNSTSVTLSVAPSKNLLNQVIRFDGHPDVYRVAAHTGTSTSLTLDGVFTGTTGSYAATVQQYIYQLSASVLKMISPMRGFRSSQDKIIGVDEEVMDTMFPMSMNPVGMPSYFAMADDRYVRFSHCVLEMTRIEYMFLQKPTALTDSDAEEPLVPLEFRHIISDYGAAWLMKDKEDARFETQASIAQRGLQGMVKQQRRRQVKQTGSPMWGRLVTRPELVNNRGPLRTSSGLIIG